MGWVVTFGIIGLAWLINLRKSKREDRWAVHAGCGIVAGIVALLWWNGGAKDREYQDLVRRAQAAEPSPFAPGIASAPPVPSPPARSQSASVEACVARGIAYFIEIGSWPTLSTGRNAATVARERCERTTTAFP